MEESWQTGRFRPRGSRLNKRPTMALLTVVYEPDTDFADPPFRTCLGWYSMSAVSPADLRRRGVVWRQIFEIILLLWFLRFEFHIEKQDIEFRFRI